MKVTAPEESVIRDIGYAFGYYDCGKERGLFDAFPSREAVAAFICGYVRMALQSGMLYTTSEKQEGFIAFRRPGEKAGLRAGLCFVKPTLGAMRLRDRIRFAKVMAKGGDGALYDLIREPKKSGAAERKND